MLAEVKNNVFQPSILQFFLYLSVYVLLEVVFFDFVVKVSWNGEKLNFRVKEKNMSVINEFKEKFDNA